jgi:hypothetical protein
MRSNLSWCVAALVLIWIATPLRGETSTTVSFACDGGAELVATFYLEPPRQTPLRVTATVDGRTRDLLRDRDNATGWGFADDEVWINGSGATLVRGANRIACTPRNAPPGGGVAAIVQAQVQQQAQAQSQPAVPAKPIAFASCWAHTNPRVKYYSALFDSRVDDARQWVPAFEGYLKDKFGFTGPVQCQPGLPESDAQQYRHTLIDQDRAIRAVDGTLPEIVDTGWKYTKPS